MSTSWTPPTPQPPPPSRPSWWKRRSKLAKIGIVTVVVVVGMAAVGAIVGPDEEAVLEAPASTVAAPVVTEATGTTEATVAPTTEEAPTTVRPEPTLPAWMSDVDVLTFMTTVVDIFSEMEEKITDFVEAAEDGDGATATAISVDVWSLALNADRAPSIHPFADEYNDWLDATIEAWDVVSDGLIYEDEKELARGVALLLGTQDELETLLVEFEAVNAELEAIE